MIIRVTAKDRALQPLADKFGRMLDKLYAEYLLDTMFTDNPPTVKEWWSQKLVATEVKDQ